MAGRKPKAPGAAARAAPVPASPVSSASTTQLATAVDESLGWGTRLRWGLVVAGALAGLLYLTWSVLSVLTASLVFAYLLDRPVTWLARRGASREFAFVLLLLAGVLMLTVTGLVIVPLVVHQVAELARNFVPYLDRLVAQIAPWRGEIEARLGVSIPVDLGGLGEVAPEYLQKIAAIPNAGEVVREVLARVAGGGAQVLVTVLTLTLIPVFTFYVCRDWPKLVGAVDELVPPRWRERVRAIAREIDTRTIAFVKGQMVLCGILGVLYSLGLLLAGIDLAVVVGMSSGVLFVIPYVGTLFGLGLSALLALLKFGFDWHVLACIGTYVGVQLLEGSVLTPTIVGDRVGLHPLVVMLGVVVFGNLLGVWGLMAAVPLTAALSVVAGELLKAWRASRVYGA